MGEFSLREIAKIYGTNHQNIRQLLKREGLNQVHNRARELYGKRLSRVNKLRHSL